MIKLASVPEDCSHNAHMFYVKTTSLEERSALLEYLKKDGILAVFHYVPLHSAIAGKLHSTFFGDDNYTTSDSERLIRLPLWYGITESVQDKVIKSIFEFYA